MQIHLGEDWVKTVLEKVYSEAKKGSYQHQSLLLAYKYGKPRETINLDSDVTVTVKHES